MGRRVIVLGGAGDMGSQVVEDLCRQDTFEKVTIGDFNVEKAEALASRLLSQKLDVAQVNVLEQSRLVPLIKRYDVVAGCVGPFYRFEVPQAEAALEAGVPYLSLCDDFDAVEKIFQLHERARTRGVLLLSGLGWTPGLSNIVARKLSEGMDRVSRIHIAWAGDVFDAEGLAVINHTIHIFSGSIKSFALGREVTMAAGAGRRMVTFPRPIGRTPVYHVGHPEPITLPKYFPQLEEVTLRGGLTPPIFNLVALLTGRSPLVKTPAQKQLVSKLAKRFMGIMPNPRDRVSGLYVEVVGEKEGVPLRRIAGAVDKMRRLTGIPLAVGCGMVATGQVAGAGVFAPEGAVPPDPFLPELRRRGVKLLRGRAPRTG